MLKLSRLSSVEDIAKAGSWAMTPDPIIRPSLDSEGDNVYAPWVIFENGIYRMWYGGQGKDGHDRIHHAISTDGIYWQKKGVALCKGNSRHVNDPSVVSAKDAYYMFYTDEVPERGDRINLATSLDGRVWEKRGRILDISPGSWDSNIVGRPSVIYEGSMFKMWYDGFDGKDRRAGYAVSKDGIVFEKRGIALEHAGAVNVQHIGDRYFMLFESGEGTWIADSASENGFSNAHLLIKRAGAKDDAFGHVTPFLFYNKENMEIAVYNGLASSKEWNRNRIGLALMR